MLAEWNDTAAAHGEETLIHELFEVWAGRTPGAIAAVAFVLGDYANVVVPLGKYGPAIHAVLSILLFTALNYIGTQPTKLTQKVLESLTVLALVAIVVVAFAASTPATAGHDDHNVTDVTPYSPQRGSATAARTFSTRCVGTGS